MSEPDPPRISVLFCCLGNICRSTMAEGVFRSMIASSPHADRIDKIDSCGTGAYHIGSSPDSRTMDTLASHGITTYAHRARKVRAADLDTFDYVFAMDRSNLSDLRRLQKGAGQRATVQLFGDYAARGGGEGKGEVVEDPYYGGDDGFETAYQQCVRFSGNFLKTVFSETEQSR